MGVHGEVSSRRAPLTPPRKGVSNVEGSNSSRRAPLTPQGSSHREGSPPRAKEGSRGPLSKSSTMTRRRMGGYLNAERMRLENASIQVQRAFRMQLSIYKHFGPDLFCMRNSQPACHGTITFVNSFLSPPSRFIALSSSSSPAFIAKFMMHSWKLGLPEVVITVVGGAQDFTLTPQLQSTFSSGLASAAMSSRAWVLTGGTNTGVMKMVGKAMQEQAPKVPVIGIGPWGAIAGRDDKGGLAEAYGDKVNYTSLQKATAAGAPLNSAHSHFLLMDTGKEGFKAWGSEIDARIGLEGYLADSMRIPLVQLVVQGGPGTLKTMAAIALKGHPIVVMTDAGGCGTAIHQYMTNGGLKATDPKFHPLKAEMEIIRRAHEQYDSRLVSFFSLKEEASADDNDLSRRILEAILSVIKVKSEKLTADSSASESETMTAMNAKMLTLAINWNRYDVASHLLERRENTDSGTETLISRAMQRALELRRVEFVRILLDLPSCHLETLQLCPLFEKADPYGLLTKDSALQKRLSDRLSEVHDSAKGDSFHYALYQQIFGPFLTSVAPVLTALAKESHHTGAEDLFIYSVLYGDEELARLFWVRCDKPVHMALLGSALCSRAIKSAAGTSMVGEITQHAERIETWAVRVLQEAADEQQAFNILRLPATLMPAPHILGNRSAVDLAGSLERKKFINQRYCQALIERWWRGGHEGAYFTLPVRFSYLLLLLYACVPFVNPSLYPARRKKVAARGDEGGPVERDMVFSAVLKVSMMRAFEKHKAHQAELRDGNAYLEPESPRDGEEFPEERSSPLKRSAGRFANSMRRRSQRGMQRRPSIADIKTKMLTALGAQGTAADASGEPQHSFWERLDAFYSIPAVKFVLRFAAHVIFMIVYILRIYESKRSDDSVESISATEIIWLIFEAGLFLDQRHQSTSSDAGSSRDIFQRLWFVSDILLLFAVAFRVASLATDDYESGWPQRFYQGYQVGSSLNAIVISLELLPFITRLHREFGVLVIMVEQMIYDVLLFLEFFIVMCIAFTIAFFGVGRAGMHEFDGEVTSFDGALTPIMFGMYAWVDPSRVMAGKFPLVSAGLLFFYLLLVHVALINLLIAMFADTYGRVKRHAEIEYSVKTYQSTHIYMHVLLRVPPPLNIPVVLWEVCSSRWRVGRQIFRRRRASDETSPEETIPQEMVPQRLMNESQLAHASLRRQSNEDAASLSALSQAMPNLIAQVEDRVDQRFSTLRVILENRSAMPSTARTAILSPPPQPSASKAEGGKSTAAPASTPGVRFEPLPPSDTGSTESPPPPVTPMPALAVTAAPSSAPASVKEPMAC
uniref:TRPM SLOG domain-containing protein n=1 Tax=Haptolina ericina TaxID=156174 RepID=A0A7S3AMF8_9EUKA|mmetsp:Transcript_24696/g.56253  ORF Transcript_24696/g.56253 Transcript_24696/m.56253 type:complete len:1318 (+) Transcript_24696:2-3955(+)